MLPIIEKQKRLLNKELPQAIEFIDDTLLLFNEMEGDMYPAAVRALIKDGKKLQFSSLREDHEHGIMVLRMYCSGEMSKEECISKFEDAKRQLLLLQETLQTGVEKWKQK